MFNVRFIEESYYTIKKNLYSINNIKILYNLNEKYLYIYTKRVDRVVDCG